MSRWAPLNDRQIKILRLVGDGNDLSDPSHESDRITGRALASRGLVTVSRRSGAWSATITDGGRHYLEHGQYADLPPDRDPALKDDPVKTAEDLLRRLQAAPDKIIRVEEPEPATRRLYRRALHAAHAHNLIPNGYLLQHTGRDEGDIIVRLADKTDPDETTWNRIRLNARRRVTYPDAIAAALVTGTGWRQVTDAAVDDAIALARSLVAQTRDAGHLIELDTKGRTRLKLTVSGITYEMHISEEYDKIPHQATPEEVRANRRNPWINKIPEFDSVPSGRLRMTTRLRDAPAEWTGLTPATFTARLRRMLNDIEAAAEEEIKQREQQRREHEERMRQWQREHDETERKRRQQIDDQQRRWQKAMADAREKAVAGIRGATFAAAFDAWTRAAQIRTFCDELETLPNGGPDLARWIAWGREEADRIDPTTGPVTLAAVGFEIEPRPDDLRVFLGPWSPHAPEKEHRSDDWRSSPEQSYRHPWHQRLQADS